MKSILKELIFALFMSLEQKHLFIILFLFQTTTLSAQNLVIQQSGTIANLRGVFFVDSLKGWVCGDSGIILHTSDGGNHWFRKNTGTSLRLEDLFFWDELNGWAVGDSGVVLHTDNGGTTWNRQQTHTNKSLHKVQFVSPFKGFASGWGINLRTTNGGVTWDSSVVPLPQDMYINFFWLDEARGHLTISLLSPISTSVSSIL